MTSTEAVTLSVNGQQHSITVEPRTLLADALRGQLGSKGTHIGCEHGVCGACTVLVDGHPVRSCLTFAVQAEGSEIETVESLGEPDGGLNSLQRGFQRHHGLQCGFCTPGILMSLTQLFREDPSPDEERIRDQIQGHICRCTGYQQMVEAAVEESETNAKEGR
ncbi:(2Fe-2S)-binding protein [Amycolatopsis acidiphila]|uniref:(2Fe-2S)-binding protein n=1 Tax=Amycolatopsis acidiphila TaxID=715473 RepID=A0A558A8B0_9PSEU|nr:(2Fe-2S)-binding protein [Amycolatopsis acidiphila]TVT20499.1 (2Fe-2S)-binding protein [Amycolatopsis acidiphila]UIJ57024.1 (2Fe-2S)-binding protein [Amycolatopsis acidiphila]GHG53783.1 (2Fe-2S)-binding protein [Amycolatopsis acidiphila]